MAAPSISRLVRPGAIAVIAARNQRSEIAARLRLLGELADRGQHRPLDRPFDRAVGRVARGAESRCQVVARREADHGRLAGRGATRRASLAKASQMRLPITNDPVAPEALKKLRLLFYEGVDSPNATPDKAISIEVTDP